MLLIVISTSRAQQEETTNTNTSASAGSSTTTTTDDASGGAAADGSFRHDYCDRYLEFSRGDIELSRALEGKEVSSAIIFYDNHNNNNNNNNKKNPIEIVLEELSYRAGFNLTTNTIPPHHHYSNNHDVAAQSSSSSSSSKFGWWSEAIVEPLTDRYDVYGDEFSYVGVQSEFDQVGIKFPQQGYVDSSYILVGTTSDDNNDSMKNIETIQDVINLQLPVCVREGSPMHQFLRKEYPALIVQPIVGKGTEDEDNDDMILYESLLNINKYHGCSIGVSTVHSFNKAKLLLQQDCAATTTTLQQVGQPILAGMAGFAIKADVGLYCTCLVNDVFDFHLKEMQKDGFVGLVWQQHYDIIRACSSNHIDDTTAATSSAEEEEEGATASAVSSSNLHHHILVLLLSVAVAMTIVDDSFAGLS